MTARPWCVLWVTGVSAGDSVQESVLVSCCSDGGRVFQAAGAAYEKQR